MKTEIINLNISELIVTKEPVVVSTVLGSCVSVCLYSEVVQGGGIIHYALPALVDKSKDDPLRYGDYAIQKLIEMTCEQLGLDSSQLKAKLVGGANNIAGEKTSRQIGLSNVKIAKEILAQYGIPIIAEDVGGSFGRKILFHLQSGRLQVALVGNKSSRPSTARAIGFPVKTTKTNGGADEISEKKKIRVLVVDDSKTIRDLLVKILGTDPRVEVVGQAEDPLKAERLIPVAKPDVITLDVHMPRMTGVEWLKTLVPKYKLPVVMITSLGMKDGSEVFEAMELGAVDYIQKPSLSDLDAVVPVIKEKIVAAASARVRVPLEKNKKFVPTNISTMAFDPNIVVAIGSSTGGTEALKEVLVALPKNIPPIVIVQHIPPVFSRAFAERMNSLCSFEVKEAENGDALHTNRVLIAPGGTQMKVIKKPSGLFVEINDDPPMNRHKPSVDYLFNSVAETISKKAIGVILTGMGADGAEGLLKMKEKGAVTMSQDEASCVVYGMPKSAWELGASQMQVPLDEVAFKISQFWVGRKAG